MALRVNTRATAFAEDEIGAGHYRTNTLWNDVRPSDSAAERFRAASRPDDYARWFLVEDTAVPADSPARFQLPIGDFNSIHRSGLMAARDYAEQHGLDDVAEAADELVFFFDRITAC